MPTCPNGHQSAADDWCEVCGHRIADASGAPAGGIPSAPPPAEQGGYGYPGPPPPQPAQGHSGAAFPAAPPAPGQGGYGYPGPPPGQQVPQQAPPPPHQQVPQQQAPPQQMPPPQMPQEPCPQCGTPREAQAPFCGECRYNFLTHTPTSSVPQGMSQQGMPQQGMPQQGMPQQAQTPPPGAFPQQQAPGTPPPYPGAPGGEQQDLGYEASRPSQMNRPAEPLQPEQHAPGPYGGPTQGAPYGAETHGQGYPQQMPPPPQQQGQPSGDWTLPPAEGQAYGQPPQQFAPQQGPEGYPQQAGPQSAGQGMPMAPPPQAPQAPSAGPPPPAGQVPGTPPQGMPAQGAGAPVPEQGTGETQGAWMAVVTPDREYFAAMMGRSGPEAAGLNLPAYSPEQQVPLEGPQITIGRRRQSTGEAPDIDLARTPEDPGVSHQHAVLVQQPDGTWSVVDQDSTNGTTINNAEDPIQPFVPVPLVEGDRVHVGAWTTITLYRA